VGRQPAADPLGFANVTKQPPRLGLVSADQDINPRLLNLRKGIPHAPQLIAAEGDGLDGDIAIWASLMPFSRKILTKQSFVGAICHDW
jgi:hypothetical protein